MQKFHKCIPMMEYKKDVYVPTGVHNERLLVPSINKSVQVASGRGHMIQFAGDQKTDACARRAQLAKVNAASPTGRLMGLAPTLTDWHTKLELSFVICADGLPL